MIKKRSRRSSGRRAVVLLVDAETGHRNVKRWFVPERGSVEAHVLRVLRSRYRDPVVVPFGPDVFETVVELRRLDPKIVFNMTEWFDGERRLDYAIAALLEVLAVRYTGAGPYGLQLCRDKASSKQVVALSGVEVPRYFTSAGHLPVRNRLPPFPLLVKPQFGDGSDAIGKISLVATPDELRRRVRALCRRNHGPVICEEFIPGRDLYVPLIGNLPQVLPPIEMVIGSKDPAAPHFATYKVKNDDRYADKWGIRYQRAILARPLRAAIAAASRRIFHALHLRDYARIDFRLTPDNRLFFIEANPNPDLSPDTFGGNVCLTSVDYTGLIMRIISAARKRH